MRGTVVWGVYRRLTKGGAAVIIGSVQVELELTDIGSLKDKRSIVKPLILKLMQKFTLHAAEVDQLDVHHAATIGLVLCGNDQQHLNSVLSKAVNWLEEHQFDAHVASVSFEFTHAH
jgi:uncharacterized protein YlxP (DUF503 family)